jgi:hypothetical protein
LAKSKREQERAREIKKRRKEPERTCQREPVVRGRRPKGAQKERARAVEREYQNAQSDWGGMGHKALAVFERAMQAAEESEDVLVHHLVKAQRQARTVSGQLYRSVTQQITYSIYREHVLSIETTIYL